MSGSQKHFPEINNYSRHKATHGSYQQVVALRATRKLQKVDKLSNVMSDFSGQSSLTFGAM